MTSDSTTPNSKSSTDPIAKQNEAQLNAVASPRTTRWALGLLLGIALPLGIAEAWVRTSFFDVASYSGSEKFDVSLSQSAKIGDSIDIVAIGSSEMLYGLDPLVLERELSRQNCEAEAFNFAIEGFGPNHFEYVMDTIDFKTRFPNAKQLFIGINMIETHEAFDFADEDFECETVSGPLQLSIYRSAFGIDSGLKDRCPTSQPGPLQGLSNVINKVSAVYRYRQQIRDTLLNGSANFQKETRQTIMERFNEKGFYASGGMSEQSLEFHSKRWKTDFSQIKYWQKPIDSSTWELYIQTGGIFDNLAKQALEAGLKPVFVANPTNPMMINDTNRRDFYEFSSRLMREWTAEKGYGWIDVGILDDYNPQSDFEDHRHVSGPGGQKWTQSAAEIYLRSDIHSDVCSVD